MGKDACGEQTWLLRLITVISDDAHATGAPRMALGQDETDEDGGDHARNTRAGARLGLDASTSWAGQLPMGWTCAYHEVADDTDLMTRAPRMHRGDCKHTSPHDMAPGPASGWRTRMARESLGWSGRPGSCVRGPARRSTAYRRPAAGPVRKRERRDWSQDESLSTTANDRRMTYRDYII
ncbi:hypothetical protein CDD80_3954 [Ophiocordyceps camponoti-rufipedis]|uniref:Uncharacterized protein n=1 Tax=Ophiocordyceps camponoti-rufipedis TaxID=2004952 RepID=A0A2C5Z0S2_9HYPO|nr:hypothetical protein CDD80_3954 [Ophiocordyceps camponoti-rufipedis]